MDYKQLIQYIIKPTLEDMNLWSQEAEDLIIGTCQQETNCGQYIHQIKGPALGIYQIEPNSFKDLWKYAEKKELSTMIVKTLYLDSYELDINLVMSRDDSRYGFKYLLIGNPYFATAICRLFYLRVPKKIPKRKGPGKENYIQYIEDLAFYYKKYYNTPLGKARMPEIINNFKKVIHDNYIENEDFKEITDKTLKIIRNKLDD